MKITIINPRLTDDSPSGRRSRFYAAVGLLVAMLKTLFCRDVEIRFEKE